MNIKKGLFLLYFLAQAAIGFCLKPVEIEGNAPFAKNGELRFYFYNDLLLQHRVLCATASVNENGYFKVQIPAIETSLLTIAYHTTYGQIFIEPEKHYKIELSADENLLKQIDAGLLGSAIYTKFISVDTSELNYKINRFERYYDLFLYSYAESLYQNIPQTTYDSLISLFTNKFPVNNDAIDYYSVYIKYKIAYIDLLYYHKEKQKLYDKYLDSPYVFYNNVAYMEFFDQFFEGYLYAGTTKIPKKVLYENINEKRNYYKLLDEMGKDPVLVNEKIREMVFIKGLGELYGLDHEFNRTNILVLLMQMEKESKFEEHRIMTKNMINHLTALKYKTEAPDFVLKDVYNSPVKLSDLKGKYVYLHFFSTYCEECIREMLVLKSIQEKYKDSLQIVSIMLDFEPTNLYHFVSAHKEFNWMFLHFDGNYAFIDAYGVYALPLGILIDSKGKIVSYPAKSPTQGLLMQIFSIFPSMEKPKEPSGYRY
jgi:thiol-disulfide isomerase/thioredoxin